MTVTVAEAEQIVGAAEETPAWVMVRMTPRFLDDAIALHRYVDAGALGDIYHGEARILRRRGTPTGWYTDLRVSGGGPLMDIGPPALDLGWWMMGSPRPIRVSGHWTKAIGHDNLDFVSRWQTYTPGNQDNATYDTEDFATALIYFETGATLSISVAWSVNGAEDNGLKVNVHGSHAGLSLDPPVVYGTSHRLLADPHLSVGMGPYYRTEFAHFIDCIQRGTESLVGAGSGLVVVQLLDAIRRSAESHRDVDLS